MLRNIVLALDESPCSERAFELALQMAKAEGATLSICSSVYASSLYGSPHYIQRLLVQMGHEAKEIVEQSVERARVAGISARGDVLHGEPVSMILEYVREVGGNAVIVGTHGRSGVRRMFLGSIAEGVMRASSVPVITVRAEAKIARLGAAPIAS
jgi:nucleotide-binding universal stress UspA family protein